MSNEAAKRVSMTKKPTDAAKPPRPRTVDRATIAAGVQVLLSLVSVALFWGFTPELQKLILDNNKNAKKPKAVCTADVTKDCLDVVKSLHSFRTGITEYSIIAAAILIFLVFLFRRGSGPGRWIYIIASVFAYQVGFAGSPMSLFVIGTETPTILKITQSLAGVASIVAIVFLLMPASATYFREAGAALRAARGQTAQRPGLFGPRPGGGGGGGLFGPRQPVRRAVPEPDPDPGPARPKSRAKVRSDADAVAKGADLARARAKASKSRRNPQ